MYYAGRPCAVATRAGPSLRGTDCAPVQYWENFEAGQDVLVYTKPGSATPCVEAGTYKIANVHQDDAMKSGTITVAKGTGNVSTPLNCMLGLSPGSSAVVYHQRCLDSGAWSGAYLDFTKEPACVDVNECITKRPKDQPSPCYNGGTCSAMGLGSVGKGFVCTCATGFSGDTCTEDVCPSRLPCRTPWSLFRSSAARVVPIGGRPCCMVYTLAVSDWPG